MKINPSTNIVSGSNNEIQEDLLYSHKNTVRGTEGAFSFDYNSNNIKLKYKNYKRNDSDTEFSETISTQFDDRRLDILGPQSINNNTQAGSYDECDIFTHKPVEAFGLHNIIQRYENHPDIMQLVLSSKVEEDKRKTEEAKLKQKELEYLIINKEEQSCRTCNDRKNSSSVGETNLSEPAIDKGKSKQRNPILDDSCFNLPSNTLRLMACNGESESQKEDSKRRRKEDLTYSKQPNKNVDNFSSSFAPSYVSPAQPNLSFEPLRKRHSGLNQLSRIAHEQIKSSSEEPVRQLQSLDYLNSRRTSINYQQIAHYHSYSEKARTNNSLPTNTLPPIGVPFKTFSSSNQIRNPSQLTPQPEIPASVLSNQYHGNHNNEKYRSLSTLGSVETSVTQTLLFDKHSDASSLLSLENSSEVEAQTRRTISINGTVQHITSLQKRKPSNPANTNSNEPSTSTITGELPIKKLPLPPNRLNSQVALNLSNRPRRRRREMQAIAMIIETKEFPYNDDYVWKNNGNTTHKSTGQKSIYYKCSNSFMGCPVNKTVTFRDNGEYLIKYRGNHLEECSKIKRIINI